MWNKVHIQFSFILFCCLNAVNEATITGNVAIATDRNDACGSMVFNSLVLGCAACPSFSEASLDTFDGEGNLVNCVCSEGYYSSTGSTPCTVCPSDEGSYEDRTGCGACGTSTLGYISDGLCACNFPDEALVDSDAAGNRLSSIECISCPTGKLVIRSDTTIAGSAYYADPWTCQSCPDPLMVMSYSAGTYSCACPSGYTLVGDTVIGAQSCSVSSQISSYLTSLSTVSTITFNNGQTVTSATIKHYFLQAAGRCANFVSGTSSDMHACQALANLCVLSLYDDTTGGICDIFNTIGNGRTVYWYQNWKTNMPWISYGIATASQICNDRGYKSRVMLDTGLLKFYVAKYSLNGTWVGLTPLGSAFGYCPMNAPDTSFGGGTSSDTRYEKFASSRTTVYNCQLSRLLDENSEEQYFYELYLADRSADKYPVPVRIVNLKQTDGTHNLLEQKDLCGSTDVLVRRFYLVDKVTGIEDSASKYNGVGSLAPTVLRYASTISLAVSLTDSSSPKIYAPVLTIEYSEVYSSAIKSGVTASYTVQSQYYKPMDTFFTYVRQFFIAGMVIMGLLFFLRYSNWSKRNTRSINQLTTTTSLGDLNLVALSKIILLAMHSWVLVFFPFLLLICWYLFVFFKIQTYPSVMLPPIDDIYTTTSPYFMFTAALHVLAFFQFGYVLFLIIKQSYADTFFIDWEPATAKADGGSGRVSVWRSILVANEWSELITARRTDIRLTMFLIIFLYYGKDLLYDSSQQPDLDDKSNTDINPVLRFATSVWWWLLFSTGQYYFNYLFYNRFISEPPEQIFVDLCTIAKISLIGLDEEYHGYYLHCRSPHQFADGTMIELLDMLQKEEAGLTVDRSLEGAPKDVQTFEIFLSSEWRQAFDKSFKILKTPASMSDLLQQGRRRPIPGMGSRLSGDSEGASMLGRSRGTSATERSIKAWKEVTQFLQQFIDNNFGRAGLRRAIREPTYVEAMFGFPPDLTAPEQMSVFFTDRFNHFTKLLFLGIESDLILLNILSFCLFDLWFGQPATAALLTYLLDYLLGYVRSTIGKVVIARKTLIDDRFLM